MTRKIVRPEQLVFGDVVINAFLTGGNVLVEREPERYGRLQSLSDAESLPTIESMRDALVDTLREALQRPDRDRNASEIKVDKNIRLDLLADELLRTLGTMDHD